LWCSLCDISAACLPPHNNIISPNQFIKIIKEYAKIFIFSYENCERVNKWQRLKYKKEMNPEGKTRK
jgi:EAL domain-containing protein (putative c-di-GMP-specific phosphodiesterase class I)